jgi:ABC-type polysaccharide/polyol phosphate transport system ATPase subunit
MSDIAIRVDNVSKSFKLHTERNRSFKEKILYRGRERYEEFVALRGVSAEIERGQTVGLMGVNGSGKSTLLKIMSRIIAPDFGKVEVFGRVSSLLELGAGFHPDFTGLENIYLNASLLGLSKKETDAKLESIIEFSELGDFIFEPIRGYSSGMNMRLAFSIATAVDPEILLLDEVLAVGDAAFQTKCLSKIRQLQRGGVTIILVSHDSGTIQNFCDRAIWLHNASVQRDGDPAVCIQDYLKVTYNDSKQGRHMEISGRACDTEMENNDGANRDGVADGRDHLLELREGPLQSVEIISSDGLSIVSTGQQMSVKISIVATEDLPSAAVGVAIRSDAGELLWGTNTYMDGHGVVDLLAQRTYEAMLTIPDLQLAPGVYSLDLGCHSDVGEHYDFWPSCASFTVVSEPLEVGVLRVGHHWTVSCTSPGVHANA